MVGLTGGRGGAGAVCARVAGGAGGGEGGGEGRDAGISDRPLRSGWRERVGGC